MGEDAKEDGGIEAGVSPVVGSRLTLCPQHEQFAPTWATACPFSGCGSTSAPAWMGSQAFGGIFGAPGVGIQEDYFIGAVLEGKEAGEQPDDATADDRDPSALHSVPERANVRTVDVGCCM